MSRKSKKINPYLPAFAGLMIAIGLMIGLSVYDTVWCESATCAADFPWYIDILPVVVMLGGALWTGKELFAQWRELLKSSG